MPTTCPPGVCSDHPHLMPGDRSTERPRAWSQVTQDGVQGVGKLSGHDHLVLRHSSGDTLTSMGVMENHVIEHLGNKAGEGGA